MKAKTKLAKLWSILLALVMVVGMLPTVALAEVLAPETRTADFTSTGNPTAALAMLNGVKTADAEDSTWDSTTKTLTLNGVNFETTAAIAVILPDDAKIVLNGDNIITSGEATSEDSFGICALGDLTINGDGKLDVTGGTTTRNSHGIYATNGLSISGTATVTAKSGAAGTFSYGICVANTGSSLTISGGTVYAEGGGTSGASSFGLYGSVVTISGDADVTAKGGTAADSSSYGIGSEITIDISGGTTRVTATGGTATNGSSYGIYNMSNLKDIKISGGTVTATGGTATVTDGDVANYSYGIYSNGNTEISGGTVNATGVKATIKSYGIHSRQDTIISGGTTRVTATGGEVTGGALTYSFGIYSNNNVTISNTATVTATGGKTTKTYSTCSYGIHASNGLSISGGTVTAEAGTAESNRALSKAPSISISPNYWWRTSESGTYTASSNNGYAWDSAHTYVEIRDTAPAAATTYKVSFDANGGSGTMEDVSGLLGDYTLPENRFTAPVGKQFKCWSVGGIEKAVGATINVTANTTVTAVWETIVTAVWETIPATSTEYDILDGANSSWTQNSDGSLSIRGSGAFSEFVGVKVDGKSVDEQYYTVKEGSTIVTLKAEYLSTLAAGPHTIQLIWKDGTASTTFNINVNNPNTGDNGGLALAAALLALSAAAIAASGFNRKRGKSSR